MVIRCGLVTEMKNKQLALSILYTDGDSDIIKVRTHKNPYYEKVETVKGKKVIYYVIKAVPKDILVEKEEVASFMNCFILE